MMPEHEMDQSENEPVRGTVLGELAFFVSTILIGLVGAFLLLQYIVIPKLGFPGDLERIAKLGERLKSSDREDTKVEIVSNSVGVEGIIASVVQEQLGDGFQVRNQSANGLDILSGRLYISRVLASDPDVLVWIVRPEMMGKPRQINPEVASVMRRFGYVETAPWVESEKATSGINQETLDRLGASDLENLVSFRTLPLRMLNEKARSRMRKGILLAKPLETDAPYQIDLEISGDKLTRHIDDVTASFEDRVGEGNSVGVELIERTIKQVQEASVTPVLVLAPTHPDATAFTEADRVFRDAMHGVVERTGTILIDLTGSLAVQEYADAIHPNRPGAKSLSEQLGVSLRGQLDNQEQDR